MFKPSVERWRTIVSQYADGLPSDIVLAIILQESGGKPGIKAYAKTKHCVNLPKKTGGFKKCCHALGLMQVIPANIKNWNRKKKNKIFYDDMIGKNPNDGATQIMIGASILRGCLIWLHVYDSVLFPWPAHNVSSDQIKLGLVAYAWGQRRLGRKLDELKSMGLKPSFYNLATTWPKLGYPHNRPIYYSKKIVKNAAKFGKGQKTKTPKIIQTVFRNNKKQFGVPALLIGGFLIWKLIENE